MKLRKVRLLLHLSNQPFILLETGFVNRRDFIIRELMKNVDLCLNNVLLAVLSLASKGRVFFVWISLTGLWLLDAPQMCYNV